MGHQVTLFEALHKTGGVLTYGIPEFRLLKRIFQTEVEYIRKLGVEIKTSFVVGKLESIDYFLNNEFDAVFLATGAGLPYLMNIPGDLLSEQKRHLLCIDPRQRIENAMGIESPL